jgi:hypothetical protein
MKKIISVILATLFSLMLFAACTAEGGNESGNPGSTPTSSDSGIGSSQGDNEGSYLPEW